MDLANFKLKKNINSGVKNKSKSNNSLTPKIWKVKIIIVNLIPIKNKMRLESIKMQCTVDWWAKKELKKCHIKQIRVY